MSLCKICLQLDFANISLIDATKFLQVIQGPSRPYFVTHKLSSHEVSQKFALYHESLDSLNASADCCDLCSLVQPSVENVLRSKGSDGSSFELRLAGREQYNGFQVIGFNKDADQESRICELMAAFVFSVDDENPLSHLIKGRSVPSGPKCSIVIEKIKKWLEHCINHHDHASGRRNVLPSRILQITTQAKQVSLRCSNEMYGGYAALSHCWGSTPAMTLNENTVDTLKNGIHICNLPQSFQDAVWVAQQLQIDYLWIDSLCIMQDDTNDWIKESSKMSDIYSNSCLTISASRAPNSEAGFLGDRPDQSQAKITFSAQGFDGEIFATSLPPEDIADPRKIASLANEPLMSRGWALQERYLSRRILHFCSSKLCFECADCFYAEDTCFEGFAAHPSSFVLRTSRARGREYCHDDWRQIVEDYSRRNLSLDSDKLPAIAGLAAHFSSELMRRDLTLVTSDRYLAGLWHGDMIRDMCWSLDMYKPPRLRPQHYRAPTWSWASVNGPIDYKTGWVQSFFELAVLQDGHIELESSEFIHGKVTNGWILLSGLKLRPYRKHGSESLWVRESGVVFRVVSTWDSEPYNAPLEGQVACPNVDTAELFLVPLGWVQRHKLASVVGNDGLLGPLFLIIKPAKHRVPQYPYVPSFQRVGFATGVWLTDASEGTDRCGLERLIVERFSTATQRGDLDDLILI